MLFNIPPSTLKNLNPYSQGKKAKPSSPKPEDKKETESNTSDSVNNGI